jgi:hypothetical protein
VLSQGPVVGALLTFGLVASVAGVAISAIAWAIGSRSGNPHMAGKGKSGVLVALASAFLIEGPTFLVNFFNAPGRPPRMSPLSGISARGKWALGATALVMLHLIAVAGIARSRPDHTKGPLARVSKVIRGPFQHVVARKDSNLRSVRDGSTDQPRQAAGQRKTPVPPTAYGHARRLRRPGTNLVFVVP